jgi:phosphoesterase RecJ-like protein
MGKRVAIVNSTPTPRKYAFLDSANLIQVFEEPAGLPQSEVVFILDISRWERLGNMSQFIRNHPGIRICIDHHPVQGNFADINLICEDACASGELVLRLINSMNGSLTPDIAEPLYASILTDTGAFRFPNTSSQTHAAASQLLSTGIRSEAIYDQIYERCSPARVKLLGIALSNLEYLHGGRLAWMAITQSLLAENGVEIEEIEGFVDIARGIRSVQASLLFIELPQSKVKISLRSRGNVDVNCFASRFGGGGHRHAAGILIDGPLSQVVERILQQSAALFPQQ